MKEQELLLKELALMLERQDMLSKLTEGKCLDEYGYSETHCIDYIGRLELPNVTKIAEHMGMTRGAISKKTKKQLAKALIQKYTKESNKKEVNKINNKKYKITLDYLILNNNSIQTATIMLENRYDNFEDLINCFINLSKNKEEA